MKKRMITTFEEAQQYIYDIPRFTSKNTLEDTRKFLQKLGNPDRKLHIIHVAGTNGKGSVCAYMCSVLEAAGKSVAVFTSPHLVDIRERFVIRGEMISEDTFLKAFLQIYGLLDWDALENETGNAVDSVKGYHPTYFEFLFLIAMLVFADEAPDYCILETGLGGRLDATNAVGKKELAVITHISLDHVEYLGDTIEKIAAEKAGIMQAGCPVIYWRTDGKEGRVFERKGAELESPVYSVSKSDYHFLRFQNKSIDFSVHTRYYNDINLTIHTIASYQMENVTLAVRALELLQDGQKLTKDQIRQGVSNCFWAGRMEEVLPEVYVDGAHNEDGIRAFLETVAKDGHQGSRTLLFSVVKEKKYKEMVRELVKTGLFTKIAVTQMQTGRGLSLSRLQSLFAEFPGCDCRLYENTETAFHELLCKKRQDERIYIAGSLYLVGEIKELCKNDKF